MPTFARGDQTQSGGGPTFVGPLAECFTAWRMVYGARVLAIGRCLLEQLHSASVARADVRPADSRL